jgi:hypothetical protein
LTFSPFDPPPRATYRAKQQQTCQESNPQTPGARTARRQLRRRQGLRMQPGHRPALPFGFGLAQSFKDVGHAAVSVPNQV